MSNWPVGTPEEVIEAGLDPALTKSCAPEGKLYVEDGEIRKSGGCQFWRRKDPATGNITECMFARDCPKVRGSQVKAFRGKGPKNIAYFHQLDATEVVPGQIQPAAFVRFMPCFIWENSMRNKYDNQRVTGEKIAVLGVEGDGQKFKQEDWVFRADPNNPAGPKIKVREVSEVEIPKFQRPREAFPDLELAREASDAVNDFQSDDDVEALNKSIERAMGIAPREMKDVVPEAPLVVKKGK